MKKKQDYQTPRIKTKKIKANYFYTMDRYKDSLLLATWVNTGGLGGECQIPSGTICCSAV